jgi:hypothetical protein
MGNENPQNICTWNDQAVCQNCNIQGDLSCRWDKRLLIGFHGIAWQPVLTAIIGMLVVGFLTGMWWLLYSYAIYFLIMFGVFEIRFLCSHCPYYAEEGKILHCLANHGSYKFWSYHPEPMNKFEKFMMYFLIVTTFFVFPLSVMGYGIGYLAVNYSAYGLISLLGLIGIAAANLTTAISFALTLKTFYCSNCVNFSCPLNSVPEQVINEYLKINPYMRRAWEKSGWIIE